MNRQQELEMLRRCLSRVKGKRPPLDDEETFVPVDNYLSPTRFARELEVLRDVPNVVAHASQLASPGEFLTRDILGLPAIVVRDDDNRARAFVNVCRHRGAQVELRDNGTCRRFVCPYHAWTYGRDGCLAKPRHSAGFPSLELARSGLRELPCMEAGGLVWVTPRIGAEAATPDESFQWLIAELEQLGCADSVVFASTARTWRANWKLLVDGGLESYHFRVAHKDTIAQLFADTCSVYDSVGDHLRSVLPRMSILDMEGRPQSEWRIREHSNVLYSIFPSASVLVQDKHLELILMTPVSVDESRVEVMTIVPSPGPNGHSDRARGFWRANHEFTRKTLDEDFVLAEQIQRGMHTGANDVYRFGRFEGALRAWHDRLEARLAGCSSPPTSQ